MFTLEGVPALGLSVGYDVQVNGVLEKSPLIHETVADLHDLVKKAAVVAARPGNCPGVDQVPDAESHGGCVHGDLTKTGVVRPGAKVDGDSVCGDVGRCHSVGGHGGGVDSGDSIQQNVKGDASAVWTLL